MKAMNLGYWQLHNRARAVLCRQFVKHDKQANHNVDYVLSGFEIAQ
jgi:hypothetical protein